MMTFLVNPHKRVDPVSSQLSYILRKAIGKHTITRIPNLYTEWSQNQFLNAWNIARLTNQ